MGSLSSSHLFTFNWGFLAHGRRLLCGAYLLLSLPNLCEIVAAGYLSRIRTALGFDAVIHSWKASRCAVHWRTLLLLLIMLCWSFYAWLINSWAMSLLQRKKIVDWINEKGKIIGDKNFFENYLKRCRIKAMPKHIASSWKFNKLCTLYELE